jgi:hypothetical protein
MRRATVYPGAVPLETDILNTNKNTMISIGHVLQDMLGTSTLFSGLACVPTGPAGMTVNVNPGRAYSLQSTDTGAYSSLASDAHQIVKQGISLDVVNFSCPAPTTAGFSINYLIEGAFQEVDAGSTVLPYYNASNPATAYSGPNNTGTSNTTYRDNTVQLQVKAGTAATTGTQVTPTPDSGFTGLWVVTVPFGASTITSGNIVQYAGAPFLTNNLLSQIQSVTGRLLRTTVFTKVGGVQMVSVDGGTATSTGAGTFTSLAATTSIDVEGCGGGGPGGGTTLTNASQISAGSGGAAGSFARARYLSGFSGGITVTIGSGGAPATGAQGTAGGATSFGALLTMAGGGAGNLTAQGTGGSYVGPNPGFAGAAPTGSGIVFGTSGTAGGVGFTLSSVASSGFGGSGPYGAGSPTVAPGVGAGGLGYGSGGAGSAAAISTAAQAGGAGAPGILIIKEYS